MKLVDRLWRGCLGVRTEIGSMQVAEPTVLFGRISEVNKCRHNAIIRTNVGTAQMLSLVAQADMSGSERVVRSDSRRTDTLM